MKVAVVGTGFMAHTHAKAIQSLGHEVSLVVGHSLDSAEHFAGEFRCGDYTDALSENSLADIDCVHICTPPEYHYEQVSLCLKAKKHVLCEKPLSLSAEEAKKLADMAEASGSICAVNFNNRFYPSAVQTRDIVKNMGRLLLIHGHYFQEFHRLPAVYSWRYKEPLRAVSEIGSHLFDQMRFFTGSEVEAVSAVFQNAFPQRVLRNRWMYPDGEGEKISVSSEDAAAVMLRLRGGAIASILLSEVSPGRSNDLSIEIVSDERSVSWCSEEPYQVITGEQGKLITSKNAFSGGFTSTFNDCFAAFYRAVETGERDERLASFRDAAVNAEIISAVEKSAHSDGAWIKLKENSCNE